MKPSRIYVAGGSSEPALVAYYIRRLPELGYTVTHDWTAKALEQAARRQTDADLTEAEATGLARACAHGIESASVLWVLAPRLKSEGAWYELGLAHGRGIDTMVSGATSNIFRTRAMLRFATHADAFAFLGGRSRGDEAEAAQ
jgi:hypothetical protein